jgi:hypothetical protein
MCALSERFDQLDANVLPPVPTPLAARTAYRLKHQFSALVLCTARGWESARVKPTVSPS